MPLIRKVLTKFSFAPVAICIQLSITANLFKCTTIRDSAKFSILHGRWRRTIVAKKSALPIAIIAYISCTQIIAYNCPVTFSLKNASACIHDELADELAKDHKKVIHLHKSIYQRPMDPSCKKLSSKFDVNYTHLCMHFSTCKIHNFVLKVSHFIFKGLFYLELIKSYCPVQACSYLLNRSVDLVVYKLDKSICSVMFAPAML